MIDRLIEWMELNSAASAFGLSRGPRSVEGNGVSFQLSTGLDGKSQHCNYSVTLANFPPYLNLTRESLLEDANRTHQLTGDEDFDDVFGISTQRVEETLRYLTEDRRRMLLASLYPYAEAHIEHSTIKGCFGYSIGSSAHIKARLQSMLYLQQHIAQPPTLEAKPAGWVNRSRRNTLGYSLIGFGAGAMLLTAYFMSFANIGLELRHFTPFACVLATAFLAGLLHFVAGACARSEFRGRRAAIATAIAAVYFPALATLFKIWPTREFNREGWLGLAAISVIYAMYVIFIDQMVQKTLRHGHY